jgi:hypothetical protein
LLIVSDLVVETGKQTERCSERERKKKKGFRERMRDALFFFFF